MENLYIAATDCTPKIFFDQNNHVFEIRGSSYLENTVEFYTPIFSWLTEYLTPLDDASLTVNIELVYFNSSSSRILLEFFDTLNEKVLQGTVSIDVNWFYESEDEDMLEFGEDFQQDYQSLVFHFIEKPQ